MKGNHCLVGEFKAARDVVIDLINDGSITMKSRTKKRNRIKDQLLNTRKAVVSSYEQAGKLNETTYEVQTIEAYKEEFKVCPREMGESVGFEFHEDKLQEVVYKRQDKKGSWQLKVQSGKWTKKEDTIDDGTATLRVNQQKEKYNAELKKTVNHEELAAANQAPRPAAGRCDQDEEGDGGDTTGTGSDGSDNESFMDSDGADSGDLLNSLGG